MGFFGKTKEQEEKEAVMSKIKDAGGIFNEIDSLNGFLYLYG